MPAAKPTLGYPSRTAAVLALRDKGKRTSEIANLIGISPKTVQDLEASAARPKATTISISPDVAAKLSRHAVDRGLTVAKIASLILETVAHDRMVDAVLDDRNGAHG